jgi:hypothetical protein
MYRHARIAISALCAALALATPAAADVIATWNVCAQPIIGAGRAAILYGAGPSGAIDLALVHLAMHDAIQAYDHRFEPYAAAPPIVSGPGSPAAAAARAAHTFLSFRFPTQQGAIDTCYTNSMTGIVLTQPELDDSNAVGMAAANNVITSRHGDFGHPANADITKFEGGGDLGQWHPNPNTVSMVAPWLGSVHTLGLDSTERCQPDDLPGLTSVEYAEAYNEVKALGPVANSQRTPEQSQIARMFSGNFLGQFNQLMRELAAAHIDGSNVTSLGDRARLFALANTAGADSVICAWRAKTEFNFWRPIHAIRDGAVREDGNVLTAGDASWTPYFSRDGTPTPNYPDYTSGANNFGGSFTRMLALFLGSDKPFGNDDAFRMCVNTPAVLPTTDPPNPTADPPCREYFRFSDIAKDIVAARVWLGIHFRFADTEARSQGRRVAQHTFKNILQPIDQHGNK